MPQYTYDCPCGNSFDAYAGYDDAQLACLDCGTMAPRRAVYREQFISCETGPKGGQKVEPPREEKSYRTKYNEWREASAEIDYAYSRVDDPKVKPPNYYKEGLKQAKKRGAKIR